MLVRGLSIAIAIANDGHQQTPVDGTKRPMRGTPERGITLLTCLVTRAKPIDSSSKDPNRSTLSLHYFCWS